jgi:endonuclease YncB( thermonuclease family)
LMHYGLLFAVSALLLLAPASTAGLTIDKLEGTGQLGASSTIRLTLRADSTTTSFTYIVQIIDPDGYTAYLSLRDAAMSTGEERAFETTWTPEKQGRHTLQAFVWAGVVPLSPPSSMTVDVSGIAEFCSGTASCIAGKVTRIVDGDTLYVDNISVRLSLVNTPERGEPGYSEATAFTASLCRVGSEALVDEDDGQTEGSYGRLVAKVFCGDLVLNEQLLEQGHAVMYEQFCSESEFAAEPWAKEFGC